VSGGEPEVGGKRDQRSLERWWGDANDLEGPTVDMNGGVEGGRSGAEPPCPQVMTENGHGFTKIVFPL
jgi:hypothetical protein